MSPKEPQDDEKHIHHSETEIPVDHQTTVDKIGSQAVSGANRDGSDLRNEYQKRIDKILSAPLTPETFDGYAEDALNDVIKVVDDMTATYLAERIAANKQGVNTEDNITGHFGISIDQILDSLSEKADDIKRIQTSVEEISKDSRVYVPPDSEDIKITNGLVEFETADTAPKVETILFMLQENYGLEIDNPKDIILISGTVSREMMRNEPYVLIDIPSLNRIILACNEKGNITYVFDQEKIKEADIPLDKLVDYTKKQLDEIIKDFESIGIRITHTAKYLPKIEEALNSIKHFAKTGEKAIEENPDIKDPELLQKIDKAPPGYKSAKGIAKIIGVDRVTVQKAIDKLEDELEDPNYYKFTNITARGFSPQDIEKIIAKVPVASKAPDDIKSLKKVAEELGISKERLQKIRDGIKDQLSKPRLYKFGSMITFGYSLDDIEKLKAAIPVDMKPPEGTMSIYGIAKLLDVDREVIALVVERLGDELDEPVEYKFGQKPALGYSADDVQKIIKAAQIAPKAVEGIENMTGIARDLGIDISTVARIISDLGERLGEINKYRFGGRATMGFTEKQVNMIKSEHKKRKKKK